MRSSFGMLVARGLIGAGIAAHGAQKAFGSFDGPGPENTAAMMRRLGFDEGERAATAASYAEMISGGLIAAGLFGPVGPALLISTMIVAMESVHIDNGFFVSKNGVELPMLYATAALAFAAGGYGECSLDKLIGAHGFFEKRPWFYAALLGSVAGAVWVLSQRLPPVPEAAPAQQPQSTGAETDRTNA